MALPVDVTRPDPPRRAARAEGADVASQVPEKSGESEDGRRGGPARGADQPSLSSTVTGTWSEGFSKPRRWRWTEAETRRSAAWGESRRWSMRMP